MSDIVRIKKKDVHRILSLYTIYGYTQAEAGEITFNGKEYKNVSTHIIAQRVLHYFGLSMEHRNDNLHSGLTDEIIDLLLDNRTIAFPLAIPVNGPISPALSFDGELKKLMGGDSRKWNAIGRLKNCSVIVFLVALTYFLAITPNEKYTMIISVLMILIPAFTTSFLEGQDGKGMENYGKGGTVAALMVMLVPVICVIVSIIL